MITSTIDGGFWHWHNPNKEFSYYLKNLSLLVGEYAEKKMHKHYFIFVTKYKFLVT